MSIFFVEFLKKKQQNQDSLKENYSKLFFNEFILSA